MRFRTLFDALLARPSCTPAQPRRRAPSVPKRPRSFRPLLETLEARTVPSTLMVTKTPDTGAIGDGSLRGEIAAAHSGDTINFAPGLAGQTIGLGGELAINKSLDIEGLGANELTINCYRNCRAFDITAGNASVTLAGLTIVNGTADIGGAIYNQGGTLVIDSCILIGNESTGGGAIYNEGTLTVGNSTLSGNTVIDTNAYGTVTYGGAIYNAAGKLSLSSSTLSNNAAVGGFYYYSEFDAPPYDFIATDAYGGAVYVAAGTVSVDHSTIAGNGANVYMSDAGYTPATAYGGGIFLDNRYGTLQVYDSIVADNVAGIGPDLDLARAGSITSLGHNLVGNSFGGSASSDLLNVNPQLGPLQYNGGPTQTMAPLAGSPAIDAGDITGAPPYDQRGPGFPRIVGSAIDIGAFEAQAANRVTHYSVSAPASTAAGSAFGVAVEALDDAGNPVSGYAGTVHFSSSDGQAVLPADYTFTAADAGAHAFSATLKTAGTRSITAADTVNGVTGTDGGITVSPVAASQMIVAGFPTSITAGVAGNLTVTLTDAYGNIASGYTGTVHFSSDDAKAVLPAAYTFTAADAGVYSFSGTLKTAGAQSISATDTTTTSLAGTDAGITVNPAAASQFVIRGPSSVNAGVAFSLTLTVEDTYGNVVTGYTGTVHFTSTDNRATLPADYTFTAADRGVHTFTGLVLRKKGAQKVTVTDTRNSSLASTAGIQVL